MKSCFSQFPFFQLLSLYPSGCVASCQSLHFLPRNQVEIPGSDRCDGIAADDTYLLVCEYGCEGADPQIVLYKRRG